MKMTMFFRSTKIVSVPKEHNEAVTEDIWSMNSDDGFNETKKYIKDHLIFVRRCIQFPKTWQLRTQHEYDPHFRVFRWIQIQGQTRRV